MSALDDFIRDLVTVDAGGRAQNRGWSKVKGIVAAVYPGPPITADVNTLGGSVVGLRVEGGAPEVGDEVWLELVGNSGMYVVSSVGGGGGTGEVGPAGPAGPPGADGAPGADGQDGTFTTVYDETTALAQRAAISFVGEGVTVTDDATLGRTIVTISTPGEDFGTPTTAGSAGVGFGGTPTEAGGAVYHQAFTLNRVVKLSQIELLAAPGKVIPAGATFRIEDAGRGTLGIATTRAASTAGGWATAWLETTVTLTAGTTYNVSPENQLATMANRTQGFPLAGAVASIGALFADGFGDQGSLALPFRLSEGGVADPVVVGGEAWNTPTLQNSWVNFGSGHQTAAYYKDDAGRVHLRGLVKNGNNAAIFTLPAGYRPSAIELFVCYAGGGTGRIDVGVDGTVTYITGSSNAFVSLAGMSFRAA